ncbi:UNVERIFIED_CONTAM: hypothetical protein Scaly_0266000 [Sesamum calycinum]|uniref:Zinc finger PMZ-type domain-containing protein n=1 Tax=Sesamum calycinum TaxID=2727403 RepID=A0AAW2SAB2_9LAMI
MVPMVVVVVPVENRQTCQWYLEELLDDIGELGTAKLSFISNWQKCLIEALKELVPMSEHSNYILDDRNKPIITMLEWIRTKLMSRVQQKKEGMEKYAGKICPNILKKLNKQQAIARNSFTRWCGESEYEVDQFMDRFVVHLGKRVCSCGMFELCGYPLAHVCAAISSGRQNLEDFVDGWYKKDTYLKLMNYLLKDLKAHNHFRNLYVDGSSEGAFSTKSAWEAIRMTSPQRQLLTDVWHRSLRPKILVFLWRFFQDRIPVDARMK